MAVLLNNLLNISTRCMNYIYSKLEPWFGWILYFNNDFVFIKQDNIEKLNNISKYRWLHTLYIYGIKNITELPQLPYRLRVLMCIDTNINTLSNSLPAGLKVLNCSGCKLKTLPNPLPAGLEELNFMYNPNIQLPADFKFPDTLKRLVCSGCNLEELPPLPPKLEYLGCGRNKLYWLPEIPASIRDLHILPNKLPVYYGRRVKIPTFEEFPRVLNMIEYPSHVAEINKKNKHARMLHDVLKNEYMDVRDRMMYHPTRINRLIEAGMLDIETEAGWQEL